jgi:hypothetical protein
MVWRMGGRSISRTPENPECRHREASPAPVAHGEVPCDSEEPGADIGVVTKTRAVRDQPEKSLLQQILGNGAVAQLAHEEAEDPRAPPRIDGIERARIAYLQVRNERRIGGLHPYMNAPFGPP